MANIDFDPFGFREIRKEQESFRTDAKQTFVNGIDPADMKRGMKVTISPNLRLGDRSYCTEIFEIEATNACHAQLKRLTKATYGGQHVVIVLAEHHVYAADNFVVDEQVEP